ncbi:MAG TPA: TIM barrel protein, partial [Rhizomicrobium sp.]|nr:TIM barrel protein [Rhizomicrobium sp.]
DRFAAAADAGFTAVEYLFPYDHAPADIAQRLARHGLEQVLFNLPPGDFLAGERGLAAFPERRGEFHASVETAINYALATGTRRLHLMAGIAKGGAAIAAYQDALKFACEATERHGIDILIEPINGRDIPGYLMNDFGLAEWLITETRLPNLKLQFDIYHRQILHGDVTRGLEALLPITGHIQVASVPLRYEPTTGELNDARVFETLTRLGYDGFIGCEYRPANGTLAGLSWMRGLF